MAGAESYFCSFINLSMHSHVCPSLLQLVVVRADLNGHLKALKDYFLLAKGDFFQVIDGWFKLFLDIYHGHISPWGNALIRFLKPLMWN